MEQQDLFSAGGARDIVDTHVRFLSLINDVADVGKRLARDLGYREYAISIRQNVTKNEINYPIEFNDIPYPFDENMGKDKMVSSSIAVLAEKSDRSDYPGHVEVRINGKIMPAVKMPADVVIKERFQKSDGDNERGLVGYKIFIKLGSEDALKYLESLIRYRLENYVSSFPDFGCCHLYQECSDAKKCLQKNRSYAGACQYKRNLDAGRIFYGKNRTVEGLR